MPAATAQKIALAVAMLCACANEQSIGVVLQVDPTPRAEVCLTAFGEGELLFQQAYPAQEGTLTFVAGDRIDMSLRVAARLRRGGRVFGWAAGEEVFGPPGQRELVLDVGRCHPGTPPASTLLGTVDGASSLVAGDLDGDGIDEVLANAASIAIVGREVIAGSASFSATSLGDVDGDCIDDVLARGPGGIVELPSARPLSAAGTFAWLGDAGEGQVLISGDADGVRVGPLDGVMRGLTGSAIADVVVEDLDLDGTDDVIAVGVDGVEAFFGGPGGPMPAPGATPSTWTGLDVAIGDFDGDGFPDVAVAGDAEVFIGRNRGDGLIESRPSIPIIANGLLVVDVDRDCAEDLIVLAATPQIFFGRPDVRVEAGPMLDPVVDATAADIDGDGARELVLLFADGEVRSWEP